MLTFVNPKPSDKQDLKPSKWPAERRSRGDMRRIKEEKLEVVHPLVKCTFFRLINF